MPLRASGAVACFYADGAEGSRARRRL